MGIVSDHDPRDAVGRSRRNDRTGFGTCVAAVLLWTVGLAAVLAVWGMAHAGSLEGGAAALMLFGVFYGIPLLGAAIVTTVATWAAMRREKHDFWKVAAVALPIYFLAAAVATAVFINVLD
ncbi:hypothetical protein GCM10009676_14720 [Prauserella halophila]|uniref:Uncharacterized protein n=1 Tax=Prauserella halophila TaxID=185641 RepID=A0ABN1W2L1_9PSEU|nr:hypothetical protein [Prauserella halophila]MCP2236318.1 hypothetical protein [Prauserella halophila]